MRFYGNISNPYKPNQNEWKWKEFTFELCIPISISGHANDYFKGLPRMEAIVRIANIPIVESGVKTAGKVYLNLKVCCYAFKTSWLDVSQKETAPFDVMAMLKVLKQQYVILAT